VSSLNGRSITYQVASLILLVTDVSLLCGLGAGIVAMSGSFRRLFMDLGAALPKLTAWLLLVPQAGYLAAIGLFGVALVVKEVAIRRPEIRLWINLAALLLIVLAAGLWTAAVILPMMQTFSALQSR
jgi:hypothetical protein